MKDAAPTSGQFGDYHWLVTRRFDLQQMLDTCQEAFLHKCLVVSAFDSGSLAPTAAELRAGWKVAGRLAILPVVHAVGELPHDQYDEWYVFAFPTSPEIPETFINYGGFTLEPISVRRELERAQNSVGAQADVKMIQQRAEKQQELLDLFWAQLERVHPETYIGDGDNFILVTTDSQLFEKVRSTIDSL